MIKHKNITILLNQWDTWCCFFFTSLSILAVMLEELMYRISLRWESVNLVRYLFLVNFIFENNCSQTYVLPNIQAIFLHGLLTLDKI